MLSAAVSRNGQVEGFVTSYNMSEELLSYGHTDNFLHNVMSATKTFPQNLKNKASQLITFQVYDLLHNKVNIDDAAALLRVYTNTMTDLLTLEDKYAHMPTPPKPEGITGFFTRGKKGKTSSCPFGYDKTPQTSKINCPLKYAQNFLGMS